MTEQDVIERAMAWVNDQTPIVNRGQISAEVVLMRELLALAERQQREADQCCPNCGSTRNPEELRGPTVGELMEGE